MILKSLGTNNTKGQRSPVHEGEEH